MIKNSMIICVTGAAGQIAYSFLPQLLRGNAFPNVHIKLRLLDIPQAQNSMKGLIMELLDSNYQLLDQVKSGSSAKEMFKDADVVVFIGGFPRKKGMERKDLLDMNKKIFVQQSKALSEASKNVKCLVVANPANTNAYILHHYNPDIPAKNITCLSRLDHNRAISLLSQKSKQPPSCIKSVCIFGNHSLTQYPCIQSPQINSQPITKLIEPQWLQQQFIKNVQNRGGEILKVRGASSVCSAASAVIDHLKDWYLGTNGKIVSMGVVSNGQYGITKGLIASFPVTCNHFQWQIVEGIQLTQFGKDKIKISNDQLQEEISLAQIPKPKL